MAIQGFQKYGGHFSDKKSACGNVVGRSGLPEMWVIFLKQKSACGNVVGRPGLPEFWSLEIQKFAYFPWWTNGTDSPGLGSCAGVMLECIQMLSSLPHEVVWLGNALHSIDSVDLRLPFEVGGFTDQ